MKKVLAHQDFDNDVKALDKKYLRVGYFDQGRPCDSYVQIATFLQKGGLLPDRWKPESAEEFIELFGEGPMWGKSYNSHVLVLAGIPILRVWTNTKSLHVWVDVDDKLSNVLDTCFAIESIPRGNNKKSKPFTKRVKVSSKDDIIKLMVSAKAVYGLDK